MENNMKRKWDIILDNQSEEDLKIIIEKAKKVLKDKYPNEG
jgi:hypothetical protein